MKKRVLSFLLCVLMVLPLMLASCGLGGNDPSTTTKPEEESVYVKPVRLNFHIIADSVVSPEDEVEIENAFNAISRKLYKTEIDFVFYTAGEYDEKIADVLKNANDIGGISASNRFENSEVVTSLNDVNIPIETYPEIANNQVDIVLINSKELYQELRADRYLAEISNELSTKFKDIEQRVSSHLINGAKEGKKMYAVPNNVLIGQYEFALVDEEMAYLASYWQKDDFLASKSGVKVVDYAKLREFAATIQNIKTSGDADNVQLYSNIKAALGVDEIYPIESTFDYPTVSFFPKATTVTENGADVVKTPDTVFGVVYPFNATLGSSIKLDNVFNDANYVEHRMLMLEAKDYIPTTAVENAAYGIRYATGNFVDIEKHEKQGYIVLELDTPRLDSDAAFNAMFAVTNYSASTERALEIIQAIVAGTDEDEVELRNILQYGVEGRHYEKDDDNHITRKNNNYMMNANYTGNLVTAYPCEADGRGDAFIGYFTEQNKDATLNPLHGMTADLLWKNCQNFMVDFYLCNTMYDMMIAEFADEEKYPNEVINAFLADIASDKTDAKDKAADRRAALIAGAKNVKVQTFYPAADFQEAYMRLYQYWLDARAGINPLAEKTDATPTAPSDVTNALNNVITALEAEAKTIAAAHLAEAAKAAEALWVEANACTTVADFRAFLDRLEELKNGKYADGTELSADDLKIYTYLYLTRTAADAADADFYGLLFSGGSGSLVYPSTLTDALAAWYYDYINGR